MNLTKPLSVYQVTVHIKSLLENDELLSGVWVEGEISNLVKAASGHVYFTLKDEKASLKAVIWAGTSKRISIDYKNGSKVLVFGNISVYEPRGEYQMIVTDMKLAGLGALYEAFEKLKKKLASEGLFDPAKKISIPFLPKGIGIVTSPTGAVIKDIYRVVRRRFPNMPLYLVPAKVQGEGAAQEICNGIQRLDSDSRVDVIIIARGGGSLEDLWPFNEEIVARAIAACKKPIISAVGHETDFTIADFVADVRAATPSVAGELVVPVKDELLQQIAIIKTRISRAFQNKLRLCRERLAKAMACRFLKRPELLFSERKLVLANKCKDLERNFHKYFERIKHNFSILTTKLEALNPKAPLARGYLLASLPDGKMVVSTSQLKVNDNVKLHFRDGYANTSVTQIVYETQ